mmetsp:Transcript_2169/g.5508  ORF Transcript_2169/g.5508 Transcript_2169/m.5508 type:complete len:592 (-) Transcript_2169:476-2251(-)
MKIIDKINAKIASGEKFFSFEYFPPRTDDGVENLMERLERMVAHGPIFCDITWGAGGTTADVTLDIAVKMQNTICVETMMHLTCTNMPVDKLDSALAEVRKHGIQNILALRGDPPKGQEKFEQVEGGFSCALDLVKHIRATHGDYFGVCVAGYPEAHPDTIVEDPAQMEKNYWENIAYLKQKVEAGGEMIVTQLFYDVDVFVKFVADCRSVGITVPIVPGIMPVMTYGGFKRMTGFCKTKVPQDIADIIESNKDNEEAIKAYGVELGAQMCRRLLDAGVPGLHMYSLNLEKSALGILERLGFVSTAKIPRRMPWSLVPSGTKRGAEGVRPVFWAQRPASYLARTNAWESFPVARWSEVAGRALAPAGAAQLKRLSASDAKKAKAKEAWGEAVASVADVTKAFTRFYAGETSALPWVDGEFRGSAAVKAKLGALAAKGLLPVNGQAAVNGDKSEDAWGPAGGHCYQKGYAEVFVSPAACEGLLAKIKAHPSLTYFAATASGGEVGTNLAKGGVEAVAWGVFPGREVVQATVADAGAFGAWASEAFALWTEEWGAVYEDEGSRKVLADIAASWHLVGVLDNNYASGDLFAALS